MSLLRRSLGFLLLISGTALIGLLTLTPMPAKEASTAETPLWCLICGERGMIDVVFNTLLFIPYGLGLAWSGFSRRRAQFVVCATTLTIELLQVKIIPGRDASLGDVLTNSLGGAIGIWLATGWRHLLFPKTDPARRLLLWGAALGLMLWGWSGTMLASSLPATTWFGQLAPQGTFSDNFSGRVLGAGLNGFTVPDGPISGSAQIQRSIQDTGIILQATALPGRPTHFLAPIVNLADESGTELMLLGQFNRDLVFQVRLRIANLPFQNPGVRLPHLLSDTSGPMVHAMGTYRHGRLALQAWRGSLHVSRELAMSPSWWWTFLVPFDYALGPEAYLLTGLWVASLIAPLAYWSVRARQSRPAGPFLLAVPALLAGTCLGLVPQLTNLPPVHWSEWAAAVSGWFGGWLLGALSLRFNAGA